jgi:uncharacterized membrane protein
MSDTSELKETGRIEAFSDGVFAIAITLLILDVRVPRPPADPAVSFDLGHELLHLWPALVAYVMGFTIILVMWVSHHRIFTIVRKTDQAFLFWNGLLLMLVTFVPFPTALLAEYMTSKGHDEVRLAAMVYAGHGFFISLAFTALWRHAVKGGRLLTPGHMEDKIRELSDRAPWGPVAYAIALVVAWFVPWAGIGICFAMVLFFAFEGLSGRQ